MLNLKFIVMNKELIYRFVEGLNLDKNRKNVVYNLIANLEQEINKPDIALATSTIIGGIKIGYVNTSKKYPVQLDSSGKAYVEVLWTDNNTTYNKATNTTLGLVKIGYTQNNKNYPIMLDADGKAYVNVPWTDTNTTYNVMTAATSDAAGNSGLVPAPPAGAQTKFLRGDGTWQVPINTTYNLVGAKDTQGLIKNGSDVTSPEGYVPCPIINGIPYYKEPAASASVEPAVAVLEREK